MRIEALPLQTGGCRITIAINLSSLSNLASWKKNRESSHAGSALQRGRINQFIKLFSQALNNKHNGSFQLPRAASQNSSSSRKDSHPLKKKRKTRSRAAQVSPFDGVCNASNNQLTGDKPRLLQVCSLNTHPHLSTCEQRMTSGEKRIQRGNAHLAETALTTADL